MNFATMYNRIKVKPFETGSKTKTVQSLKDECNINSIMEKARRGIVSHVNQNSRMAMYGDFTGITNFQDAQNKVIEANNAFMAYPANIRARFDNDPIKMINFLNDPQNESEAVKMGLMEIKEKVEEIKAKVPKNDKKEENEDESPSKKHSKPT